MKLKLKPSARLNRRYILIEGSRTAVEKAILDYIGILGWAKAAPHFVNTKSKQTILAVERKSLIDVRAALEMSKEKILVKKVSGTLKGLH